MTEQTADDGLKNLVQQYNVGFWASPDRVDIDGRVVEVTFQLELRGNHRGCRDRAIGSCRDCMRVLMALFEIADALSPLERVAAQTLGGVCEKCMSYARERNSQGGVSLWFELKSRRPFEQADNGWAMVVLDRMRQFLFHHGCYEIEAPADRESEGVHLPHDQRSPDGLKNPASLSVA